MIQSCSTSPTKAAGKNRDNDVEPEAPHRPVRRHRARLLPQIAAIVPDYCQHRAQLDENLKRAAYATLEIEKVSKDDQMAGGRNRQELGDPFDNAEHDHSPISAKLMDM